jgi:hypothetical protein
VNLFERGVQDTEQASPRVLASADVIVDALGIVVRLRVLDFSTTPALMPVSIQVLTLTVPVPSPLWVTVIVLSTMVFVEF